MILCRLPFLLYRYYQDLCEIRTMYPQIFAVER